MIYILTIVFLFKINIKSYQILYKILGWVDKVKLKRTISMCFRRTLSALLKFPNYIKVLPILLTMLPKIIYNFNRRKL